jgi:hypothetical protein
LVRFRAARVPTRADGQRERIPATFSLMRVDK